MPGIVEGRNDGNQSIRNGNGKGFWSNRSDDVSYSQLQKFWNELSPQARQKLLRIDKQTLFEHARKNMYCSRCNGLLLEGFLQIVMYGKSLQQEGAASQYLSNGTRTSKTQNDGNFRVENGCQDDAQDPSVHSWGGLTATRDGMLTLLDRYLFSNSLKGLQNVFDSARARERERELLYPDACGGGGRGWISQGMAGYGRGHGTRETCALHTARLAVDTLVDFWSALGEETRQSLLRMKEEDFIERLMYRFDSKRFCRDCRRNVIREFKELKELKRMRKEPHCTSWFCVADTAFQYEVSQDTVQADWHRTFVDTFGVYHHFEWAIGTGEGKSDVLDFENVGLSGKVLVTGLDLSGLKACYITLRAWKMDGRCTELSVKAHALKGQQCVHCRLGVDDGFVTITRGESIRRFFEHAEEAEEEEDDDSIDKDGNDLDVECSRPQKHAKSPELAREFLLDAATVIFKEQVEKAFREGTARQNAHSIFVCQALKLLEERVHVSCKEIITLEKQMKLLEEEEIEKREEEERKERRKNKEREKKLRRKERLREKDKDKKGTESNQHSLVTDTSKEESVPCVDEVSNDICDGDGHEICGDSAPLSPNIEEEQLSDEFIYSNMQDQSDDIPDLDYAYTKYGHDPVSTDKLRFSRRKLKFQKDSNVKWPDRRQYAVLSENGNWMGKHEQRHHVDNSETSRHANGTNKFIRNDVNSNTRNDGPKVSEKFHCSNPRTSDRHESHTRGCNHQSEYRVKLDTHLQESKYASKPESASDVSKPYYRGNKNNHVEYARDSFGRLKSKSINSYNPLNRDATGTRRVWEPMGSHKKYTRSNSDSDFTSKSTLKDGINEYDEQRPSNADRSEEVSRDLNTVCDTDGNRKNISILSAELRECTNEESKSHTTMRSSCGTTSDCSVSSSSNSDNCSSCLSDSNASLTNSQNIDSSSTSDSEDSSQNSEGRESSSHTQNEVSSCHETSDQKGPSAEEKEQHYKNQIQESEGPVCSGVPIEMPLNLNARVNIDGGAQSQTLFPPSHNQSVHFPIFQPPTLGFYHQSPISWPAIPTNGFMPFPHPSHYVFPSPYGYGLNGNTQVMPYGSLQHLPPPVLNHGHLPVFHPVAQSDGINFMENQKIANLGGPREDYHSDDANIPKGVLNGEHTMGATEHMENGKPSNPTAENAGFSLFHFGGPVALSTGLKSSPISSKKGTISDLSPSTNRIKSDHAGNPKNCGEEYNLFAASNGMKFSFF